jgi:uncharacterized membrane-anchored protein
MNALELPIVQKFFSLVVDPVIRLLFAAAVAYFIFGVFKYIRKADDSDAHIEGGNHILWGTVGLAIMFSVWGIIALLKRTIGA